VTEDLCEKISSRDILSEVELVATDGALGGAEVAEFPRQVEGAEGGGNVLGELRAGVCSDVGAHERAAR
jgi:hypothetical protein